MDSEDLHDSGIHEHHEEAAHHHEQAAKHHREAAKHHKAGHHEKAAHHSNVAPPSIMRKPPNCTPKRTATTTSKLRVR